MIGGILGHQIGGHNKDIATVGGAALGGLAGANINRITGQPQTQEVQKCASAPSQTPTYWDVSYYFRGQDHRVQMTSQPGPTVTVNERGAQDLAVAAAASPVVVPGLVGAWLGDPFQPALRVRPAGQRVHPPENPDEQGGADTEVEIVHSSADHDRSR